jgi:hypothetical protein
MRRNQVLLGAMLGFGVFYVSATIALGSPPEATASGAEVVRWFRANDDHVRVWLWFSTFALVFFGVYAAEVRRALPAPQRDLFFAGAVTLIAVSMVQGWIWAGLALHPPSGCSRPPLASYSTSRRSGDPCSSARRS